MSNMDHFSSRKKVDDIFKEDKGRSVIPLCNQARDYVEVFSAQGKDPAQNWAFRKLMPLGTEIDPREAARIEAAREQKGMVRVYAPEVKGYYVRLTQQASLPKAPLKLELIQPYVVFQTFVPSAGNGFRVRLEVSTERGAEKTLFLSSGLKTSLLTNPERKCLPLPVQSDVWLNLVVDLADLVQNLFPGDKFYALKGIELESSCRIRRIFTVLKKPTADTFAPRDGDQAGDAVVVGRVRSSTQGWSARKLVRGDPENFQLPTNLLFPSKCVSSTIFVDSGEGGEGTPVAVRISDSWVEVPSKPDGSEGSATLSFGDDSDEDSVARGGMYDGEPYARSLAPDGPEGGLHFDNVRLYAAKKRADAKIRVLEEQYKLLKGGFLPELDEALESGRKSAERAARMELELQRSRQDLRDQTKLARGLESELEGERGCNIEQRIQIRNLQGLLLRSKGQANGLLRQLAVLSDAQAPLQEQMVQEKRSMEKERRQTLEACDEKVAGFQQLAAKAAEHEKLIASLQGQVEATAGGVASEEQRRVALLAEHSAKARAWAAEVSGYQSGVRLRDAQLADLSERLRVAQGEVMAQQASGQLYENQGRELDVLKEGAGRAQREAEVLRTEVKRLLKSLSVAKREKEMEVERKEREQAVTLAKLQLAHDRTIETLRDRVHKADQTVRIQHLRLHQGSVASSPMAEPPFALDEDERWSAGG